MATSPSLFGPSVADVRAEQNQEFLNAVEIGRRNPDYFAGASAGNLFGRAISEAFGARDPRIIRAQRLEQLQQQAVSLGLRPDTPDGLESIGRLLSEGGFPQEGYVAATLGSELRTRLLENEKTRASTQKTKLETLKLAEELKDLSGTTLRSRVNEARKADPDAMADAENVVRPEDFKSIDDYHRALLDEATTQRRAQREFGAITTNPVTGERETPSYARSLARIRGGNAPQTSQNAQGEAQGVGAVPTQGSEDRTPSAAAQSLVPDAPAPVVTSQSEVYRPPKGTIKAGTPQQYQNDLATVSTFISSLNRYLDMFEKKGVTLTLRPLLKFGDLKAEDVPPEAQPLMTAYRNLITQWNRDMAKLGALQGADLGLLEEIIPPPVATGFSKDMPKAFSWFTGIQGGFGIKGDTIQDINRARKDSYREGAFILRQLAQGAATRYGRPFKIPAIREIK